METIEYRRKKVEVKTIPKGTVLFRTVTNTDDDVRGYPLDDGTRCITPNQNVFFYPNPFTGEITQKKWFLDQNTVSVYKLTRDVKVLWLLTPSKNTRATKNTARNFIKRCSLVPKGCLLKPRNEYDPCVSDTIIKKYPEIVGMAAIAINDAVRLNKGLKRNSTHRIKKYLKFASDANGTKSVPELILHPLTQRPQKDVLVREGDVFDTNYQKIGEYKLADESALRLFMDKLRYNPDTFFYQL